MAFTLKAPPAQTLLVTLILLLFALLFLQDSYFEAVTNVLQIHQSSGETTNNNSSSRLKSSTTGKDSIEVDEIHEAKTLVQKPLSNLPGFCDYCGPEDLLCQQYGEFNLARSRQYEGPNGRLKKVIRKAQKGGKIKIGVLGGSVTAGHGVDPGQNWVTLYGDWWKYQFPQAEVEIVNGAVPASETSYFETCFGEHIDDDVDLVVIEMAINDRRLEELAVSYEYLLRTLLELPNKPAVVNLHIMALSFDTITMGGDLHTSVASYYDTPVVSVRNVLLPHIFSKPSSPSSGDPTLEDYWFHHFVGNGQIDLRHMNFNGHRLMSDLLVSFSERVMCSVLKEDPGNRRFWRPDDPSLPGEDILEAVPRLRLFDKYDREASTPPAKPSCMSMRSSKHPLEPLTSEGWEVWAPAERPDKTYIRATVPGSTVSFAVHTATVGQVRLTFLHSKSFGMGSVWCWMDDTHSVGARIDGYWDVEGINTGGLAVVTSNLTPGDHILHCTLLEETEDPNGGHDFRIIAIDAI